MKRRTRTLIKYLERNNNYPASLAQTTGEIVDGMIARSPHRTEHIYNAIEFLTFKKDNMENYGEKKLGENDARLFTNIRFTQLKNGRTGFTEKGRYIIFDFDFNPQNHDHLYILTHELGHAIHQEMKFTSTTGILKDRTNCMTKTYQIRQKNGRYTVKLLSVHAKGLAEAINDFATYDLQQLIGHKPELINTSPYLNGKLLLYALDQKYDLKNAYRKSDEQLSYDVLRRVINKKAKIKTSMFRTREPIEVLRDYCDNLLPHARVQEYFHLL